MYFAYKERQFYIGNKITDDVFENKGNQEIFCGQLDEGDEDYFGYYLLHNLGVAECTCSYCSQCRWLRMILGSAEGMKEDKTSWGEFFKWLKIRGLQV